MFKRLICYFDQHQFDLADLNGMDSDGLVHVDCLRCGKHCQAEYGLALPGKFIRNSSYLGTEDMGEKA